MRLKTAKMRPERFLPIRRIFEISSVADSLEKIEMIFFDKKSAVLLAAVALSLCVTAPSMAQGGPPPGRAPMFGSPQMMQKFQEWRAKHKNTEEVQHLIRGLAGLESNPATALNKKQARVVLGAIGPWRTKPTLPEPAAAGIVAKIASVLTPPQKNALKAAMEHRRGMGGGPGGHAGGPGAHGFGGPDGPTPAGHPGGPGGPGSHGHGGPGGPPRLGDFNPLNPASLPAGERRQRQTDSLNALIGQLKQAAK
jgi:hypothetical protein